MTGANALPSLPPLTSKLVLDVSRGEISQQVPTRHSTKAEVQDAQREGRQRARAALGSPGGNAAARHLPAAVSHPLSCSWARDHWGQTRSYAPELAPVGAAAASLPSLCHLPLGAQGRGLPPLPHPTRPRAAAPGAAGMRTPLLSPAPPYTTPRGIPTPLWSHWNVNVSWSNSWLKHFNALKVWKQSVMSSKLTKASSAVLTDTLRTCYEW